MDVHCEAVLAEYEKRAGEEAEVLHSLPPAEGMSRRDEFLICVGRHTGTVLNILVARDDGVRHILEVGTAYGYSTLWLAEAARATGGRVTTLELHPGKQVYARGMLERAGLADFVDFRLGDALALIEDLAEPPDLVLIDLWKELYVPCLERLLPRLAPGAWVAADNMLDPPAHRAEAETYRAYVRHTGRFDSVLLPIGSGVELSRMRS
jgi:predicted O-methyltransferase YrrM